jgi:hypothetical protein
MKSFLLRFEELRVQAPTGDVISQVASVAGVADSGKAQPSIVAGTKTLTEVKSEGTDSDPRRASFTAFPKVALHKP